MEKGRITRTVSVDLAHEMQRVKYEMAARENILAFLVSSDKPIKENPNFAAYQEEYTALNAKYLQLKKQVETEYVLPEVGGKKANWELDFEIGRASCRERV